MQTAERRTSSGIESGSGLSTSLSQMNTVSQNLTSKLSNTFGFTAAESRELATISQTTGSVDAGLSALADKWGIKGKGELGVKLASIINENTGRRVSADQAYDEVRDFASSEINSTEARSARDSFNRETSSLTNSRGENLTERLGSTISHANDVSRQASQVEEAYNRFSRDFQVTEGAGYSVTDNDSQKFAEFVQERMLSDSLLGHYGSIPQILHPATPEQRQVRDILLGEFVQQKHEDLAEARRAMGIADPAPMERTLAAPPISTAEGIRGFGEKNRSAVRGEAPEVIVRSNSNDPSVGAEVAGRLEAGERRVAAGATALADQHDAADRRAANLTTSVSEREEGSMLGNIPYVSPLVEGAWDGVKDATGWVADKLEGIGIGSASMSGPVQSALPRSGVGFRSYSAPQKQFGTSAVIGELQESSAVWAARGGTSINIGDISNRGGGDMAGHDSHERGRQVDVRPFRHDGANRPTDWRSSSYDRDQTRSYVEMMKHRNPGMTVLFNDPLLIREGLTQPYSGHDNHLHLTFPNEDLRRPGSAIPDTFPVTPAGFVDPPAMQAQREWDAKIQSLRSGTWTPLPPEELGFSNLPASNKTGVGAERDEGPVAQSSLNTFREWDGETANSLIAEPSSQTRHKEGAASLSTKASDQAEERHPPHSVSVEGTSIIVGEEGTPWTEFENAGGELREVYDRVAQRLGSQDDARIDTEIDRQLRAQFETAPDLAQRMIADSRARHGRTETYDTEQLAEQVAALRMSDPSKAAEVQREILESLPGENRKAQFTDELRRVEGYSEAADQRLASLGVAQTGEGRRLPLESQLVVRTADRLLDEATYSISGGRSRPGVDRLFHDRTDIAALTYSIEALAETDPILARAIRADLAGRLSPADRADLNRMLAGDLDFGEGVGQALRHPGEGLVGAAKGFANSIIDLGNLLAQGSLAQARGEQLQAAGIAGLMGNETLAGRHHEMAEILANAPAPFERLNYDTIAQRGGADLEQAAELTAGLGAAAKKGLVAGARTAARTEADESVATVARAAGSAGVIQRGVSFEGTLYRAVPDGGDPLDISYSVMANHRYTAPGQRGLYFSSNARTVEAEFVGNGSSMTGRTVHSFPNTKVDNLFDLTDPHQRTDLSVTLDDITRRGGTEEWRYEVTQPLGRYAQDNGYSGIVAPSAQADGGVNVIIFYPADIR